MHRKLQRTAREGLRIRVVGLNTALLAADEHDKEKLHLGKTQWSELVSDADEDELAEQHRTPG